MECHGPEDSGKKKRPSGPLMNQKDVIVLANIFRTCRKRRTSLSISSLMYERFTYKRLPKRCQEYEFWCSPLTVKETQVGRGTTEQIGW